MPWYVICVPGVVGEDGPPGPALSRLGYRMNKHTLLPILTLSVIVFNAGCRHVRPVPPEVNTTPIKTTCYRAEGATAEVITSRGESIITVLVGDRVAFRRAYVSDSGQNGQHVVDAAWSPAGRFFAFKTTSSGGHMPYRSPVTILGPVGDALQVFDAESIIRKIPDISNIAVSHYAKPWLRWLSATCLQVNVMSHDKPGDGGFYIIDLETMTATKSQQTPVESLLRVNEGSVEK